MRWLSCASAASSGSLLAPNNFSSGASDCIEIDEIIEEDVVLGGIAETGKIKIENFTNSEVEKRGEESLFKSATIALVSSFCAGVRFSGEKVGCRCCCSLLLFERGRRGDVVVMLLLFLTLTQLRGEKQKMAAVVVLPTAATGGGDGCCFSGDHIG